MPAKSDKLALKVAKARQAAFAALQGGLYGEAAKACLKAERFQTRLIKAHKALKRR